MFEAVLPLKIAGGHNDEDLERAQFLIRSLDLFWTGPVPLKLTILAQEADMPLLKQFLRPKKIKVALVPETKLLPCLADLPLVSGWLKQQALKLAAHRLVTSKFYMTLDADNVCTRPVEASSLIVDGKALTDWEPRKVHPEWWIASAALLGVSADLEAMAMSVTPAILAAPVAAGLEARLAGLFGPSPWAGLLNAGQGEHREDGLYYGWSEYTLYHLYAESAGLMDTYHWDYGWCMAHRKAIRESPEPDDASLWHAADAAAWNPAAAFEPSAAGSFIVVQSNTSIPFATLRAKLDPLLQAAEDRRRRQSGWRGAVKRLLGKKF